MQSWQASHRRHLILEASHGCEDDRRYGASRDLSGGGRRGQRRRLGLLAQSAFFQQAFCPPRLLAGRREASSSAKYPIAAPVETQTTRRRCRDRYGRWKPAVHASTRRMQLGSGWCRTGPERSRSGICREDTLRRHRSSGTEHGLHRHSPRWRLEKHRWGSDLGPEIGLSNESGHRCGGCGSK